MTLRSNLDCVCLLLGQWIKLDITILSTIVTLNVFLQVSKYLFVSRNCVRDYGLKVVC